MTHGDMISLATTNHVLAMALGKAQEEIARQRARIEALEAGLTKIRDLRAGYQLGGCDTPEELANAYGRIASTAWETAAALLSQPVSGACELPAPAPACETCGGTARVPPKCPTPEDCGYSPEMHTPFVPCPACASGGGGK